MIELDATPGVARRAEGHWVDMSDPSRHRPARLLVSSSRQRPPWWLIRSWPRWAWFTIGYPLVLSFGVVGRLRDGRGRANDWLFAASLALLFLAGLVMLAATLLAYRRDPGLRTRTWPPPPALKVSRQVSRWAAALGIGALVLVLLLYAGWGAALFVGTVLGLVAFAVDRFDLFTEPADDPTPRPDPPAAVPPPPGWSPDR